MLNKENKRSEKSNGWVRTFPSNWKLLMPHDNTRTNQHCLDCQCYKLYWQHDLHYIKMLCGFTVFIYGWMKMCCAKKSENIIYCVFVLFYFKWSSWRNNQGNFSLRFHVDLMKAWISACKSHWFYMRYKCTISSNIIQLPFQP